MVQKAEFNSVGENSVQLYTNPCPPFMTLLIMLRCFTSTGFPCPCGCGNIASVPKVPFISYSRIPYFGHVCPKLNLVLISRLTGKRATQH